MPGCGVGVRPHLCAGRLWHLVQAHSSCSSPQPQHCHHAHLFRVAFIGPRLCCRQQGWSGLWRGLEWALERAGVSSGKPQCRAGECLTQERSHGPAEHVRRGPGSSAAAKPQHQGSAWPDPPTPPTGTHRAEEESPTARGTRGFGDIQQEVLGSRAQAGAAPCPPVELNLGTVTKTPARAGWGARPAPTPCLCPPDWAPKRPKHAAVRGRSGAHGQSVPCPVSHGAGRHRAPAAPAAFPWEKRPRCRGATGPGPPAPARAGN